MGNFAVIDTETNWIDQVMSIGLVIADEKTLQCLASEYYVLTPEYHIGGMYEGTLFSQTVQQPIVCSRAEALAQICHLLTCFDIRALFAYNASFDRNHLPELKDLVWYDIMRLAAYRQFNPCIPADAECFSTGRMKRGYGVEPILRMLTGQTNYRESHNALDDAMDELEIIRLLGYSIADYIPLH